MSRRIISRGISAAIFAAASGAVSISSVARAADSASIVALTQGTVKPSLTGGTYDIASNNMGDWPLNTGTTGGGNPYAISYENPDFNGNAFGGTPNTMIALGSGGSVTLQFATPIAPIAGERDLGVFTAQAITGGAYSLNGYMEAQILVSADDAHWYTLNGTLVTSPSTYVGSPSPLNAPTMAYNYVTGAAAWNAGAAQLSAAQIGVLSISNYTTPMPNDNLFNGTGTSAQRSALTTDSTASDYAAIFGASGGGNWFDVSGSGLSQVDYVMLNGDANEADNLSGPASGGVRLDAVFANANAVVPEPASLSFLIFGSAALLKRRRRLA